MTLPKPKKPCRCGHSAPGWHKCCTRCDASATGEEDAETVFGFYRKKGQVLLVQSSCRACRTAVKPAAAPRMARRTPYASTVEMGEGAVGQVRCGPSKLTPLARNTPEGASRVPEIDDGYRLEIKEKVIIGNALKNAENTWIYGPSGSGKTSGVAQMCALLNWPLYRLPCSGDMGVADFVGQAEATIRDGIGVTEFVDGLLIRALLNGGVLLIDEVTAIPAHILIELQQVLERPPSGRVVYTNKYNGGEITEAHENFRIICTDNTNGRGDTTGAYAGTNAMNESFRSRFSQWFRKEYPATEPWIAMLVRKIGIVEDVARKIVKVAEEVNSVSCLLPGAKVRTDVGFAVNPRDTLDVARLYAAYGDIGLAYDVGLLDGLDGSDRVFFRNLLRNHKHLSTREG